MSTPWDTKDWYLDIKVSFIARNPTVVCPQCEGTRRDSSWGGDWRNDCKECAGYGHIKNPDLEPHPPIPEILFDRLCAAYWEAESEYNRLNAVMQKGEK